MPNLDAIDAIDAKILLVLGDDARLSGVEIAQRLGLSRNTVQSRLARLEESGRLGAVDRRVLARALGYPLTAFVSALVDQHLLAAIEAALTTIPEVVEVHGVAGGSDVIIQIVARNTDDLYRIAGAILASPGIQRTEISLSMHEMVAYRLRPLLERRVLT